MYRPLFVECPAIAAEARGATGLWCLAYLASCAVVTCRRGHPLIEGTTFCEVCNRFAGTMQCAPGGISPRALSSLARSLLPGGMSWTEVLSFLARPGHG